MKKQPRRPNGMADRLTRAADAGRKDAERGRPNNPERFSSKGARDAYARAYQEWSVK